MLLGLLLTGSTTFVSCSSEDNPSVKPQTLTEEEEEIQYFLNKANERENVNSDERATKYAPYKEWRRDSEAGDEPLFNLRLTIADFDFTTENAKELPDPDYVPTRQGFDDLTISGSARPNKLQLAALADTLKKVAGSLPIIIVDLRTEMHGIINGHHLSQYGFQNWGTIGMTREEIIEKEKEVVHSTLGKTITHAKIGSSTNYEPADPKEEEVTEALTMEEATEAAGLKYYRITALDHVFQSDETLDSFFEFYRSLPAEGTWLHFHCQAGRGRTTFFMSVTDMLNNPGVSLKDILHRQVLIGGTSMYNDGTGQPEWRQLLFKEISVMLPIVYQYIQENAENGYTVKWSSWKLFKYGYLLN